jgi:predicted alpha-1,2-mannosidase
VEVFHAGSAGKLKVQLDQMVATEQPLEPGLQVVEIAAAASAKGRLTRIRLGAEGRLLHDSELSLRASPTATPADYVDVFKGTAHSRWMIAPGPWMPFGMVKLAPDNQPHGWASGYEYSHEYIDCFSHIHEWTMGGLGVMPTLGDLRTQPGLDGAGYSSRFDKSSERGGIGFYEVLLKDTGIKVELAATTRTALQRYTYPATNEARVLFDFFIPNEYAKKVLGAKVRRTGPAEIEGVIETDFSGGYFNNRFDLHFVAQFSRPFDRLGGWQDKERVTNANELTLAGDCGAWVDFTTRAGEQVLLRTGISLVSVENARLNLELELAGPFGWDFAAVVQNQRRTWNELLGRVEIETPDAREKTRFYTNLYRTMSGRNIWSDVNGEWIDPEERRQKLTDPNAVMLGGDAFWNTFWNLNQVMNLLAPEWSARWVQSLLAMYDTSGWLSKAPAGLEYIAVMVAEHEIPLLVAAHQHGIKGVDAEKILEASIKMQTTLPQKHPGGGYVGNEHLENYLMHGYVALDGPTPAEPAKWTRPWVSNTFEYAYDDWCVAQLALALGRKDVADAFLKRSQNWRNVFDAGIGFVRPRKASGEWLEPFDPYNTPGFVEGNAWQYTWFVPHDMPGLIETMGRDRFISRLNEAFEKSAATRFSSPSAQHHLTPINHGNQPSMQVAWLFNWAGAPWLTQKWARAILDTYYGHNPADAYLGDEDQGQMSGWFVMAALGLFQTDGGARVDPIYEIGSPLYPKAVLHLSQEHYGGGTFTIEARNASRSNRYIQSAALNGQPLNRWWIRQKELVAGGRLEIELGPEPNEAWARGAALPE